MPALSIEGLRQKRLRWWGLSAIVAIAVIVVTKVLLTQLVPSVQATSLSGGDTTVFNRTSRGYEQPAPNLSEQGIADHFAGDLAFDAVFVTPPARVNPGLGPYFNNASCTGCHIRNGRGLPEKGQLLVRVSQAPNAVADLPQPQSFHLEATVPEENTPPVPGLGTQIQDQAVYGQTPEAAVKITWSETPGTYGDGSAYNLRSPQPQITLPSGEPLPATVLTSLRIPPPVFGLGLLEAVPEALILQEADPDDRNQDGISGRANQVWDVERQRLSLGRFGLKANQPNLLQQSAAAYAGDMGVTSSLFPEPDGTHDIDDQTLKAAVYYAQTLGVPARTQMADRQVKQGEKLFTVANCNDCHIPKLKTRQHTLAELSQQTIYPYTDLLLHDMGPGLADGRPDFLATGNEWRTPPLWGVGLTQTVLPYASYLHDGRARTLEEAILWHGGEAEASQESFRTMDEGDRAALVRFLRSL